MGEKQKLQKQWAVELICICIYKYYFGLKPKGDLFHLLILGSISEKEDDVDELKDGTGPIDGEY